MSFQTVKLGDCCTKIGSGATPKGGKFVYEDTGISLIRSQNVRNLNFDPNGLVHINSEAAEKLKGAEVLPADVLLNITGDSVARTCLVANEYLPARVNQHVAIIRPINSVLDNLFLSYYLASPFMQSYMLELAYGKGASRNALTKEMIASFKIPCPPLEKQAFIASVLHAYNKLIENNRKQIKLLEEAAQRLYKEWFVDLRFPGYEHTAIVDGIPDGWKFVSCGSLLNKLESGSRPKGGAIKNSLQGCVSVGAENVIGLGLYDYSKDKYIPLDYAARAEKGHIVDRDILIYKDGAYTGRMSLFQDGFPHKTCMTNEHVFLLRCKDLALQYWLFFTLQQKSYYSILQALASAKSAQPGINQNDVCNLKILLPPQELVERFNSIVTSYVKQIFAKARSIKAASEARDRFLPKLMSGEIEVD